MSTAIKRRRGTAAEHSSFAGLEGELTVNTTNKSVHVHDGSTAGGHELARADLSNVDNITPTATGIDVTGTVVADGLNVTGSTLELTSSTYKGLKIKRHDAAIDQVLYMAPVADTVGSYIQNNASYSSSYNYTPESTNSSGVGFDTNGDIYLRADSGLTVGTDFRPTNRLRIQPNGDISFYEDTGTTAKFFWDASAESLGIGTSSPTTRLDVAGTINASGGYAAPTTGAVAASLGGINIGANGTDISGVVAGLALKVSSADPIFFHTSNLERMRIDSSGNLLVGQSSTNDPAYSNIDGIALSQNFMASSRTSATTLFLNRKSTDGAIAEFKKDGTTVGSIGSYIDGLFVGSTGGSDAYMKFYNSGITPATSTGTTRDAAINLGEGSARWKDLYLSGGVYLGGTGSANYLDDYETGTFTATLTPTVSGSITLNSSIDTLEYTKVGNLVTITGRVNIALVSSPVGGIRLTLPFTVANGIENTSRTHGMVNTHAVNLSAGAVQIFGETVPNTTQYIIYEMFDAGNWVALPASNLTGSSVEYIGFSLSYVAA